MRRCFRSSTLCFCLATLFLVLMLPSIRAEEDQNLIGGWGTFPPYSYVEDVRGIPHWKGLDVDLLREIAKRAGYSIEAVGFNWPELIAGIKNGDVQIVPLATRTPEREGYATFSMPYRSETMVLIVREGQSDALPADTIGELVNVMKSSDFRLGVGRGVAYPSEEIRAFIADPANGEKIVELETNSLIENLMIGRIDGYLSDRIRAANVIEIRDALDLVEEHPVMVDSDLHLMFSAASVSPKVVADFNRAIESVHADGTYRDLNERYAFPILVRLTLDSNWFFAVDIVGTIAFALSGLLLAFRYNYDVFGALVLASLPAVGGGVVRDLITNRETLAVLASPIYIEIIVVLVVGGYAAIRGTMAIRRSTLGTAAAAVFDRRREQVGYLIQVSDALGLAAFTVTGVVVALATQSNPLWLWGPILAAITAAGGGILRDVVRSDPDVPFLKGELYPEIAVLWGLILSLYFEWQTRQLNAEEITFGIVVTFLGAFLTRMVTMHFGLRSPRFSIKVRGS